MECQEPPILPLLNSRLVCVCGGGAGRPVFPASSETVERPARPQGLFGAQWKGNPGLFGMWLIRLVLPPRTGDVEGSSSQRAEFQLDSSFQVWFRLRGVNCFLHLVPFLWTLEWGFSASHAYLKQTFNKYWAILPVYLTLLASRIPSLIESVGPLLPPDAGTQC